MRIIASLTEIIQAYVFPKSSIDQLGCFNHPFNLPPCRTMVQDITSGCSCQTKAFCKSISVMRHCLPSPASPGRRIRMWKGPPIDKFIIYTCVYIYIHYMYAYIVLVDPFLGSTNFEPAICLAGWSRIASIMSIKPLNQPRPVLHSLRKNSEKKTQCSPYTLL